MKQGTKTFLKLFLFIIVIPVLTFFVFGLPWVISSLVEVFPVPPYLQYLGYIGLYGAIPLFIFALHQIIKFLGYVNRNQTFSELSLRALKNIKYSGTAVSILYVIGMPLILLMAEADDAPGAVLFGLIVISASAASAFFANRFEKKMP